MSNELLKMQKDFLKTFFVSKFTAIEKNNKIS